MGCITGGVYIEHGANNNSANFIKMERQIGIMKCSVSDKYILQLGQIHLAFWTNTFQNLKRYISIGGVIVGRCIYSVFLAICAHLEGSGSPDEWKKRHIGIVPQQKFAMYFSPLYFQHTTFHCTFNTLLSNEVQIAIRTALQYFTEAQSFCREMFI